LNPRQALVGRGAGLKSQGVVENLTRVESNSKRVQANVGAVTGQLDKRPSETILVWDRGATPTRSPIHQELVPNEQMFG